MRWPAVLPGARLDLRLCLHHSLMSTPPTDPRQAARLRIDGLRAEIAEHNRRYYQDAAPDHRRPGI